MKILAVGDIVGKSGVNKFNFPTIKTVLYSHKKALCIKAIISSEVVSSLHNIKTNLGGSLPTKQ